MKLDTILVRLSFICYTQVQEKHKLDFVINFRYDYITQASKKLNKKEYTSGLQKNRREGNPTEGKQLSWVTPEYVRSRCSTLSFKSIRYHTHASVCVCVGMWKYCFVEFTYCFNIFMNKPGCNLCRWQFGSVNVVALISLIKIAY